MSALKSRRNYTQFVIEILEIAIITFALSWFLKTYLLGFATVKDSGMFPTLDKHHQVFMVKIFNNLVTLENGDIIVYMDKNQDQKIKRIIGLAGNEIEIRNGFTYINEKPLYEPYAHIPLTYQFSKLTVSKDHVFVLNDNRFDQNDSRLTGSIPKDQIIGKAIFCYWPWSNLKGL